MAASRWITLLQEWSYGRDHDDDYFGKHDYSWIEGEFNPEDREGIKRLLQTPDLHPAVHSAATLALARLGDADALPILEARMQAAISKKGENPGSRLSRSMDIGFVLCGLRHLADHELARVRLGEALREAGPWSALSPKERAGCRMAAARVFIERGNREDLEIILVAASSAVPDIRSTALLPLAEASLEEAWPILMSALGDSSPQVRLAAAGCCTFLFFLVGSENRIRLFHDIYSAAGNTAGVFELGFALRALLWADCRSGDNMDAWRILLLRLNALTVGT